MRSHPVQTRLITLFIVVGLSSILVTAGFINARIPLTRKLNLTIVKPNAIPGELTLVMASDIHLGTLIANRKANHLVKKVNALHPDLVVFAGDIVDEYLTPVINSDLGKALSRINSRLSVYAVTGNHEYIGGVGSGCCLLATSPGLFMK